MGSIRGEHKWEEYWSTVGDAAEGNPANLYRERLIARRLGALGAGSRLLDIGSGQGELALALARRFPAATVRGLELSESGVARATEAARRRGLSALFTRRDLLDGRDVSSDEEAWATHAVCSEVLEHVDDPANLVAAFTKYLAPGCRVVVTVPAGPRSAFDRHIGHRDHFTPRRLRALLSDGGLVVERIDRAGFPFFNLYKLGIILQGDRLIGTLGDLDSGHDRLYRAAGRALDVAFRVNLAASPFGWQLVAAASNRSWCA